MLTASRNANVYGFKQRYHCIIGSYNFRFSTLAIRNSLQIIYTDNGYTFSKVINCIEEHELQFDRHVKKWIAMYCRYLIQQVNKNALISWDFAQYIVINFIYLLTGPSRSSMLTFISGLEIFLVPSMFVVQHDTRFYAEHTWCWADWLMLYSKIASGKLL